MISLSSWPPDILYHFSLYHSTLNKTVVKINLKVLDLNLLETYQVYHSRDRGSIYSTTCKVNSQKSTQFVFSYQIKNVVIQQGRPIRLPTNQPWITTRIQEDHHERAFFIIQSVHHTTIVVSFFNHNRHKYVGVNLISIV